jgi:hypothetical protein
MGVCRIGPAARSGPKASPDAGESRGTGPGLDNLTLSRKEGWRRFVETPARVCPESSTRPIPSARRSNPGASPRGSSLPASRSAPAPSRCPPRWPPRTPDPLVRVPATGYRQGAFRRSRQRLVRGLSGPAPSA